MSPQISVDLVMRCASHNLNSSTQSNQKNLKECPKISIGESRQESVPTPMHRSQCHGTRKLITITCIKRVPTPMPRSHRNPQVDHHNTYQVFSNHKGLNPTASTQREN